MTNKLNKFPITIIGFALMCCLGCSQPKEFKKDCDLCYQVDQKKVETAMINFVYNNISVNISKEAEIELTKEKEILHHGHKFIECGCVGDVVIFHLWCANDKTYQLEVEVRKNNDFLIIGIKNTEFSHP